MQVSRITTPCYCRDNRDNSQFLCWVLGYHYERIVSFNQYQHAVNGAARGPYPPAGSEPVPIAAREESETVCCIAGVVGYGQGSDVCLPCQACEEQDGCCEPCACLSSGLGLMWCFWTLVTLPLAILAALLCIRWEGSPSSSRAPKVRQNRPYRCCWAVPLGYCSEKKEYQQPGVPPVVKREVCTLVFCAKET